MAVRGRPKPALILSDVERQTLQRWSSGGASPALALRARIVLASADGEDNRSIAVRLGVWPQTVGRWRARFIADRLPGLADRPRPGAPRKITDEQVEQVVVKTLEQAPDGGATSWSTRSMASATGLSQTAVSRIWRAHRLRPDGGLSRLMNDSPVEGAKRRTIMEAARTVFLRNGYSDASMEEIATLAAVSKQTLYKHFVHKRQLFTAVIAGDIQSAEQRTHELVEALGDSGDLTADLRRFARQHIKDVTQPHLIQLRRIIIAEAGRFPELARFWYAQAPARAHATLAQQFRKLARRGLLRADDPLLAAQHFNWLILSIPLNRAMFLGDELRFPDPELERYADEGVRVFLAAYGDYAGHDGRRHPEGVDRGCAGGPATD
jgi:TetR/AcrR family transcriptional repressor of mexJK operon